MSASQSQFAKLQALAQESCSTKRRELLRDVTDLFFNDDVERSDNEGAMFDEIIGAVARDLEVEARAELAEKVSHARRAPRQIARRFAMDEIEVAAPVLARSTALTDDDLIEVANSKGQGHLRAMTKRETVSERVSAAIVDKGNDHVVASLLGNTGASLSRETYETVTDRALESKVLAEPLVGNKSVPLDLLNEMYMVVGEKLRHQITSRNEDVDPKALEEALANSRTKVAQAYGALPADYADTEVWLRKQHKLNKIKPPLLVQLLRGGEDTKFLMVLADLTGVDFATVQGIKERSDVDALAMICRASEIDRALFVTLAVLIGDKSDNSIHAAGEFGALYNKITVQAAQRAIRFLRVRKTQERRVA